MTAREMKEALFTATENDYTEALEVFATYIKTFEKEKQEEAIYNLDKEIWKIAQKNGLEFEWVAIFTELLTMI